MLRTTETGSAQGAGLLPLNRSQVKRAIYFICPIFILANCTIRDCVLTVIPGALQSPPLSSQSVVTATRRSSRSTKGNAPWKDPRTVLLRSEWTNAKGQRADHREATLNGDDGGGVGGNGGVGGGGGDGGDGGDGGGGGGGSDGSGGDGGGDGGDGDFDGDYGDFGVESESDAGSDSESEADTDSEAGSDPGSDAGSDSEGEAGSDDGGDEGAKGKGKPVRRGGRVSAFHPLVQPRPGFKESDESTIAECLAMAEAKKKKMAVRFTDTRGLTLLQIQVGLEKFVDDRVLPVETFLKLVADDPILDGIKEGSSGTTLTSPKFGKGRVDTSVMEKGHRKHNIKWNRKSTPDGKYSTNDVLREADAGQGVSLEETREFMVTYMCVMLVSLNTHGCAFIKGDAKRIIETENEDLTGDNLARAKVARPFAWERIHLMVDGDGITRHRMAADTVTQHGLDLLTSDATLVEALRKTPHVDLLGFKDAAGGVDGGKSGLMKNLHKGFGKKQLRQVDDWVKSMQAACRLRRLPELESFVFPMALAEIPAGTPIVEAEEHRADERIEPGEVEGYGLASRAIMARARVDGTIFCGWMVHFPLYRLLALTRPEGKIKDTSEHNKVAKTLKTLAFVTDAKKLRLRDAAWKKDMALWASVHAKYRAMVAPKKKKNQKRAENAQRKVAYGNKVKGGRVHRPGSPFWKQQVDFLKELVEHNAFSRIMGLVDDGEVEMCIEVLRSQDLDDMLERDDEFQLMPKDK